MVSSRTKTYNGCKQHAVTPELAHAEHMGEPKFFLGGSYGANISDVQSLFDEGIAWRVLFKKRFEGLTDVNSGGPSFNFAGLVQYFILCKWWYCAPLTCYSHSEPPYKFIITFCKLYVVHGRSFFHSWATCDPSYGANL